MSVRIDTPRVLPCADGPADRDGVALALGEGDDAGGEVVDVEAAKISKVAQNPARL